MNKFIGYAKGSSEKKLEEQKKILKLYVNNTEYDVAENNHNFESMLGNLDKGDTVVVTSLKIISHDARRIIEFVSMLEELGVYFIAIEENINTSMAKDRSFAEICILLVPYSVNSKMTQKKKDE